MTENKRFYYNTFYHADDMSRVLEYEIIDRQSYPNYPNHDEKEDIPNWYIYIGENDSNWQDMLINLLNQLNDENQHLKGVSKELKEGLKELKEIGDYQGAMIRELDTENQQLIKENENLKHIIKRLCEAW